MTIEEKAKAYDEALERAKAYHRNELAGSRKEMTEYIFPELRESEDERIRKEIIDFLETIPASELKRIPRPLSEWFSYFEKQKDAFENGRQFGIMQEQARQELEWPNEKQKELEPDIELIQKTWYMEGYQDRKHNLEPMWIIKTGEGGPRYEENPKYGQELVKEQKPDTFNEPYNPDEYDVVMEGNAISLKRKEQKSVDYDHEMWKNCEANFEGGKKEVIDHPEKYGLQKEQKSAWSEEDEKIRKALVAFLEMNTGYFACNGFTKVDIIQWLKSFRPSWKPSEEQMRCLCEVVDEAIRKHNLSIGGYPRAKILESLYKQLQKL